MYQNVSHIAFLSFLLWFSVLLVSCVSSSNDIVLACGSSQSGEDSDKRKWEPDTKFIKSDTSMQATASYQDPSLLSTVPYMTARIFTSPATYQIPVTSDSRYFLRFHFYPSTYSGLNISDSYFSLFANDVTLLSNFSAAITCQALTQAYLVKEYSLAPVNSNVLNITFVPAENKANAFAFINGIEVVQMPDMFGSGVLVGFNDQMVDAKSANIQTMFRLNAGGNNIPATQDSGGLSRTWYSDAPYVFSAGLGVNLQATDNVGIKYKGLPDYSAPYDVYKTARAQGPTGEINVKSNLTWSFQVDPDFTYILRLHFCEFQLTKVNQRVFNIYINNQTAQADADILAWTGEKGVPTYKDYAIYVNEKNNEEEIWLQMSPSTSTKPEFLDSQVNGLEIFKIENGSKSLAGPNPKVSPMQTRELSKKEFSANKKALVIVGSVSGMLAVMLCTLIFVVYRQKARGPSTDSHTSSWLPVYGNSQTAAVKSTNSGKSKTGSHLTTLAAGLCCHYSLAEIKRGTKNFDEANVIGVGGFGKVYKGVIEDGTKVAIKRSNPNSEQGMNEFETEIELLSRLRHKHLVSLMGFCDEDGEMCLVYDYMAFGTLREHLYNTTGPNLPWKQRLELCIGAARGLHYLHTGAKYTIIHRDVKTTNILIDENWVAKVSDFGLSKTGPDLNNGQGHVSTVVKGSFGYLDPEYFRRQQLTEKSDVYSFGVVLFEVLCARAALNANLPKEQISLADWALNCMRKEKLEDIIDPNLKGKINPECLKKFAETAQKCLSDSGVDRPTMADVLWNLEFALQIQETADRTKPRRESSSFSEENGTNEEATAVSSHFSNLNLESENDISDQSYNDLAMFSQIIDQKGR